MTLGQIYNIESFKRFTDSGKAFKDSAMGAVLERNLTAINPKILEKKYAELSFLNSGVKADNTGGYARKIQSLRVEDYGDFADSSDIGSGKGRISLSAEDTFISVFPKQAHSIWTDDEIKEAQMGNINLPQRYIMTHKKAYSQKIDEIGYLGHNGQEGLLNTSLFTTTSASDSIDNLSGEDMYEEIATLITEQLNDVNNTPEYSADTVVMPIYVMNKLQGTIYKAEAGSATVLKALKDNFPFVKFVTTFRAKDVDGTSKVVAYSTSEDAMVMRIPQKLTIGQIVKQASFEYRVDSKFRIAGLDILEKSSGRVLTGL